MTLLILGSTGMLGRALMSVARSRNLDVAGAARSNADHFVNAADSSSLNALLDRLQPTAIINCIAVTDLNKCESEPKEARAINEQFPGIAAASSPNARFIQISTDHFFTGDGEVAHPENAAVHLVNEYARSKYAAEQRVASHNNSLVVRTNMVGWRGWANKPTFLEWAVASLERGEPLTGFTDYYTSPIDALTLGEHVLDLVSQPVRGILNIASREVSSKYIFLRRLADALGWKNALIEQGSVRSLRVPRAESAGLDVSRAEAIFGRRLPTLDEVIRNAIRQRADFAAFQG